MHRLKNPPPCDLFHLDWCSAMKESRGALSLIRKLCYDYISFICGNKCNQPAATLSCSRHFAKPVRALQRATRRVPSPGRAFPPSINCRCHETTQSSLSPPNYADNASQLRRQRTEISEVCQSPQHDLRASPMSSKSWRNHSHFQLRPASGLLKTSPNL